MAIRVLAPDSHGRMIDEKARRAFLSDLKALDPDEIVMLGDHVDCSGVFSSHPKISKEDQEYSYKKDIAAGNAFLDQIQDAAPRASIMYLEGNHELRIQKWASNTFLSGDDTDFFIGKMGPAALLNLKERNIRYFFMHKCYHGLSSPGTIKLGKCYFTHGISTSKHASATHVERFGANIVHGHTHRAQSHLIRTIAAGEIGGWCPGTLSKLQPLYLHSAPSNWTHGYGLQFVNQGSGTFLHINVPIVKGKSFLLDLTSKLK